MASYRIDKITLADENVSVGYSIIIDDVSDALHQTVLAAAQIEQAAAAAVAAAAQSHWERETRWEVEALPSKTVEEIEALRAVVVQANAALTIANAALSVATVAALPDGGRDTVTVAVADVEVALSGGSADAIEQAILLLVIPRIEGEVRRVGALRAAYNDFGVRHLGVVVQVN